MEKNRLCVETEPDALLNILEMFKKAKGDFEAFDEFILVF